MPAYGHERVGRVLLRPCGRRSGQPGPVPDGMEPGAVPGQTVAAGQPACRAPSLPSGRTTTARKRQRHPAESFPAAAGIRAGDVGEPRPTLDYAGFQALAGSVGHAPGWGPAWVAAHSRRSYVVEIPAIGSPRRHHRASPLLLDRSASTWRLEPTTDGYYRLISDATGLCADMQRGTRNRLGVVEQEGAPVTAETCAGTTTQEWQIADTRWFPACSAICWRPLPAGGNGSSSVTSQRTNWVIQPRSTALGRCAGARFCVTGAPPARRRRVGCACHVANIGESRSRREISRYSRRSWVRAATVDALRRAGAGCPGCRRGERSPEFPTT